MTGLFEPGVIPTFLGTDNDLEYYVRECGDILGINNKIPIDKRDAKHILEYVLNQVVEFKKLNQELYDDDQYMWDSNN